MSRRVRRRPPTAAASWPVRNRETARSGRRGPRRTRPGTALALAAGLDLHADVREQPGQQRHVHTIRDIRRDVALLIVTGVLDLPLLAPPGLGGLAGDRGPGALRAGGDADLLGCLAKLAVYVLPFAHPQVVQVLAAAQPPERRSGQLTLPVAQVVPQNEKGQE